MRSVSSPAEVALVERIPRCADGLSEGNRLDPGPLHEPQLHGDEDLLLDPRDLLGCRAAARRREARVLCATRQTGSPGWGVLPRRPSVSARSANSSGLAWANLFRTAHVGTVRMAAARCSTIGPGEMPQSRR